MSVARLPPDMTDFLASIDQERTAWTLTGEQVIFLDLLCDRYFSLREPENAEFRAGIARGDVAEWHLPTCLPKPGAWAHPASGPPMPEENRLNIAGVAAALWIQHRIERRMETLPFHQLLIGVRKTVEHRFRKITEAQAECLLDIVEDFERARLIRSAANRCVPRSLALVLRCATYGIRAHAVIGVKTKPFEAHCWAQHGSAVLTDPLENVIQFTPILVI